jgi:DNA-binding transcriptional LysR family regulator
MDGGGLLVSKDLLADLPAFLEVAERLSFRAAAEAMDLTPAALSKAIGRLESRLGQPLMTRTTRRVALTPAGVAFRARAAEALDMVGDAMAAVRLGPRLAGRVQVVAPASLLPALGAPLGALIQRHHGLTIITGAQSSAAGKKTSLKAGQQGADLELHFGPSLGNAGSVHLGLVPRIAVAAPAYAARHGLPASWSEPASYLALDLDLPDIVHPGWDRPSEAANLTSSDTSAILAATLAGAGIARLWQPLVAADLAAGRLLRVLPGDDPPPVPIAARVNARDESLPRVLLVLREVARALGLGTPDIPQATDVTTSDATAPSSAARA